MTREINSTAGDRGQEPVQSCLSDSRFRFPPLGAVARDPRRPVLVDYARDVAQDHDSLDARSDDRGLGASDRYPFFGELPVLVCEWITLVTYIDVRVF